MPLTFLPAALASTPIAGVDLWLLDFSHVEDWFAAPSNILSADELIRAETFKKNKHHFLATRVLLRKVLAHYTELNAQELVFSRTPQGKPFLVNNPVYFNLSHCTQFAVLAISTQGAIGVDIENLAQHNFLNIARRYFHPEELLALNSCAESERRVLFYKLWTLKEAFFKATGGGISTGLHTASFSLASDNIKVDFAADLQLNENEWQFTQAFITPSAVVAVAQNTPHINALHAIELQWFDANALLIDKLE